MRALHMVPLEILLLEYNSALVYNDGLPGLLVLNVAGFITVSPSGLPRILAGLLVLSFDGLFVGVFSELLDLSSSFSIGVGSRPLRFLAA